VDEAVISSRTVKKGVLFLRQTPHVVLSTPKEIDWHDWLKNEKAVCAAEPGGVEHPLSIFYTSGTTEKPKGVGHVHGGYMVGAYSTTKYVFHLKEDDVYFCVADPG